jgi:hypothetical protein
MRRALMGLLLGSIFASFAMADAGSAITPSLGANDVCDTALSAWVGNPLDWAIPLSPPEGCTSICSAAHGKSCSPAGNVKSCFDVNQPEGCLACICTSNLVWNCGV